MEPSLHIGAGSGWLNDPNGPIWWKDRWHVFFQHNPHEPQHACIHWAHVSSADLRSWRREPIALRPRPGAPDAAGCWSGCVTSDDGVPAAVYTGVADNDDPGTVCIAHGDDDLTTWTQPETPVATVPPGVTEMRDPFVFHHEGGRWAVVGARLDDGRAAALLFSCDDLRRWEPRGTLATSTDPVAADLPEADIWECPQLARVDGRWVLILSLWRARVLTGVAYLVGDVVPEHVDGLHFAADAGGLVDAGRDYYAPAVLSDSTSDRGLLWGWSWEARSDEAVTESGWAGVLTLPRELRLSGDLLLSSPAPESEALRGPRSVRGARLEPGAALDLPGSTAEVLISVPAGFDGGVQLIDPLGTELLEIHLSGTGALGSLHWSGAVAEIAKAHRSGRPDEIVTVWFLVDRTVVEAFCSHHTSATARTAASEDGTWRLRSRPSGSVTDLPRADVWTLESR